MRERDAFEEEGFEVIYALTPGQCRILRLTCMGLGTDDIADELSLAPHTVHNNLVTIYSLLGVHDRLSCVLKCLRKRYTDQLGVTRPGRPLEGNIAMHPRVFRKKEEET